VQQNVVGLERGIGFQFAAPVAIFMLLRKKIFAGGVMLAATRLARSSILPKRSWVPM